MALTLRLNEAEEQQLEAIKQIMGASTSSAALKQMIKDWDSVHDQLKNFHNLYHDTHEKLQDLEEAVTAKLDADRYLTELIAK